MLIRTYIVGCGITARHKSCSLVGVVYLGGVARRLRLRPACCQRSHPTSRRRGTNVTALGCEGQLFVSFYVFGSGFNEANEPSSACRLWRHHRVETGAPPRERAPGDSCLILERSRLGRNECTRPGGCAQTVLPGSTDALRALPSAQVRRREICSSMVRAKGTVCRSDSTRCPMASSDPA